MSFNIEGKEGLIKSKPTITINLPPTQIGNSELLYKSNEYIKYAFNGIRSAVKINNVPYNSNHLYLWKGKIHNIPNVFYDAELIIETNNGHQKTFICFLLKHSYSIHTPTAIDNLWNNDGDNSSNTVELDLVNMLPSVKEVKGRCIYYKDGINTVIINTQPIFINGQLKLLSSLPKCFLFSTFTDNYNIVKYSIYGKSSTNVDNVQTVQENTASFIEGLDPDSGIIATQLAAAGLYLDCSPTSQSTDTLPSITIPLDKNGNVNLSNSLLYSSIMNSLTLFIIIAFVILALPSFYKVAIVDVINKINVPDKATRLTTVTYFIGLIIATLVIALSFDGFKNGNTYESYSGIMFGIMLFAGIIRMFFLKNNKEYSFQKVYNWNPIDIYEWLKETYRYIMANSSTIMFYYIVCNIVTILAFVPAALTAQNFVPPEDTISHVLTVILGVGFAYNFVLAAFFKIVYDAYSVESR